MSNDNFSNKIRAALLLNGQAFPVTDEEVAEMEELLEKEGYPEIPEHLRAKSLVTTLRDQQPSTIVRVANPFQQTSAEIGLSRAARKGDGTSIPAEVEERMRKDKARHESSKK